MMELTVEKIAAWKKVNEWLGSRKVEEADMADYFWALQVQGEIQKFRERTKLQSSEIAMVANRRTGRVYLQWLYAPGRPLFEALTVADAPHAQ